VHERFMVHRWQELVCTHKEGAGEDDAARKDVRDGEPAFKGDGTHISLQYDKSASRIAVGVDPVTSAPQPSSQRRDRVSAPEK
jgi:hypothetical protein